MINTLQTLQVTMNHKEKIHKEYQNETFLLHKYLRKIKSLRKII